MTEQGTGYWELLKESGLGERRRGHSSGGDKAEELKLTSHVSFQISATSLSGPRVSGEDLGAPSH